MPGSLLAANTEWWHHSCNGTSCLRNSGTPIFWLYVLFDLGYMSFMKGDVLFFQVSHLVAEYIELYLFDTVKLRG